jgi:Ca2+-transporting ATPase
VPDDAAGGLSSEEAQRLLAKFGPNQIYKPEKVSFLGIARHEITEPMILLLFVVGIIYSVWGNLEDAVTIFAVIIVLVLAEVNNEFRAKKAITALDKLAAPKTKVLRDGIIKEIDSLEVVPGDVLILSQGTKISADARIIRSAGLQLDESALTGESIPKDKSVNSRAYAGTVVSSGEGTAVVTTTGAKTEFGKIASKSKEVRPPRTKLQLEMRSLSGKLVYVALFFSVIIPLIGILQGRALKMMVLTGLSLAFATIPEELPIIITMVLGLGAYMLSKNNLLVKRLVSAEALGTATVIVTDKTGTITEGRARVVSLYPKRNVREIIETALGAVTDYSATYIDNEIRDYAGRVRINGPEQDIFRQRNFGDKSKTRAVIRKGRDFELFLSGAPEEVFACCGNVDTDAKKTLYNEAAKGRRVIAVASRRLTPAASRLGFESIEKDMEFVGLISFEDSVRKGVKETIARVARAGVRTIMVTGDHPSTALFIAKKAGIKSGRAVTGDEMDSMSDSALQKAVKSISVFARASPMHKYRIMKALQDNGEVVVVTGDGINDVLALQGADVGIAMGLRGTDVAKDAASVVLADDNYVTIAQGIFEGRKFFDNLQKGIEYYLSVKVALVAIFLLPVLLAVPLPFAPIQIIVLELFMDLAASAGFVAEPEEKDIDSRPPRDPKARMFNRRVVANVMAKGLALFVAVMAVYFYARSLGLSTTELQTYAFSAWMFGYIALAFVSRSDREPIRKIGLLSNKAIDIWMIASVLFLLAIVYVPALSAGFGLTPIGAAQLLLIAAASVAIVLALEVWKYVRGSA